MEVRALETHRMTKGELFHLALRVCGGNKARLAKATGISLRTIHRYAAGDTMPDTSALLRLHAVVRGYSIGSFGRYLHGGHAAEIAHLIGGNGE